LRVAGRVVAQAASPDVVELTVQEIEAGLANNSFTSAGLTQSFLDRIDEFESRTTRSSRSTPTPCPRQRPSTPSTAPPARAARCTACRS
jgi:hypothetical protein